MQLINPLGKVVFEQALTQSDSEVLLPTNVEKGLYFVRIFEPGASVHHSTKLIIE